MKMKFKKALRDLTVNPKRTLLVVFALFIGIWGIGTVGVSYYILTNDLDTNFQKTKPAHLVLSSENFKNLKTSEFENKSEIENAEFRDFTIERIEILPDVWVPLYLYGVEDFKNTKVAKILPQEGGLTTKRGSVSIERDGRKISNIEIGSSPKLRIGHKIINVLVSNISFDPAQAPATQDHLIYAYTDKKTFSDITGKKNNQRLIVRLNNVYSQQDVKKVSQKLLSNLEKIGITVTNVEIPLFNEHPHQWQLNTILFVVGVIGLLAFILGSVLVMQLMRAILSKQIQQIGIMKATGSSRFQVFQIYIIMLLLLGFISGILAIPLSVLAGSAYAKFVAGILNFDILTSVPVSIYLILFLASLILPLLLSLSSLLKGTKISVKEALSDYGINNNINVKPLAFLSRFNLSNTFLLSIKNSLRNSERLMVTIITMALGVAIFSTGFNVRQSLWELLSSLETELQYDVQVVLKKQITKEDASKPFKSLTNVKSIDFWNNGGKHLKELSTQKGASIISLPFNTDLITPKLIEGNWLTKTDKIEVVLNQQAWEIYDYKAVGSIIDLNILDTIIQVKLVGVVEQLAEASLYIDETKYNSLFNPNNLINTITFVANNNDYENVIQLKKNIEKSILPSQLGVAYVMSDAEKVKVIFDHLNIILSVIVFLSFLVLLVSAIGMATATGINIGERTREIGIMRSIGATPKIIYKLFVYEGMIISVISILIGLILSYPLSQLASVFFGNLMLGENAVLSYAFSPLGFIITIGITIAFGWLASRIPAVNAVKITTRDALSYE